MCQLLIFTTYDLIVKLMKLTSTEYNEIPLINGDKLKIHIHVNWPAYSGRYVHPGNISFPVQYNLVGRFERNPLIGSDINSSLVTRSILFCAELLVSMKTLDFCQSLRVPLLRRFAVGLPVMLWKDAIAGRCTLRLIWLNKGC